MDFNTTLTVNEKISTGIVLRLDRNEAAGINFGYQFNKKFEIGAAGLFHFEQDLITNDKKVSGEFFGKYNF